MVSVDFLIAIKLNFAAFQSGGFGFDDSETVGGWLNRAGVDPSEISGGTYEQPKSTSVQGTEQVFEKRNVRSTCW